MRHMARIRILNYYLLLNNSIRGARAPAQAPPRAHSMGTEMGCTAVYVLPRLARKSERARRVPSTCPQAGGDGAACGGRRGCGGQMSCLQSLLTAS